MNGQTVKCKLGKGKIWRVATFHKFGPKIHCEECKDKVVHHLTLLCEKHLKEKIEDGKGKHFHEKHGMAYKGQQSWQTFMENDGKVFRRAVEK